MSHDEMMAGLQVAQTRVTALLNDAMRVQEFQAKNMVRLEADAVLHRKRIAEEMALHDERMRVIDENLKYSAVTLASLVGNVALHEDRIKQSERDIALHNERMAHIDMRLAEITDKMDGLTGFMNGFFRKQ